jgi:hypothetical protein
MESHLNNLFRPSGKQLPYFYLGRVRRHNLDERRASGSKLIQGKEY